jgi:flagellin
MVNNSIYTNPSAYLALQHLSVINRKLEVSQSAISSGLKVASATDNTSSFAIAQGIRGEIAAIESTGKAVTKFKGIVDYTLAAAEGISGLIGELKGKLTEMTDTSISASQRTQIETDFKDLISQAQGFARGAANLDTVNGQFVDLFSAGGTVAVADISINVNPGISGLATATTAAALVTVDHGTTSKVFGRLASLAKDTYIDSAVNAASTLTIMFGEFEGEVAAALGHLGLKSEELAARAEFLEKVKGTRQEVLGAYVDADLAAESAKLTALQVQQQLAVQAVGIANQRPQSLLGLFR